MYLPYSGVTGAWNDNFTVEISLSVSSPVFSDACHYLCGKVMELCRIPSRPHTPHFLPTPLQLIQIMTHQSWLIYIFWLKCPVNVCFGPVGATFNPCHYQTRQIICLRPPFCKQVVYGQLLIEIQVTIRWEHGLNEIFESHAINIFFHIQVQGQYIWWYSYTPKVPISTEATDMYYFVLHLPCGNNVHARYPNVVLHTPEQFSRHNFGSSISSIRSWALINSYLETDCTTLAKNSSLSFHNLMAQPQIAAFNSATDLRKAISNLLQISHRSIVDTLRWFIMRH